tara:strand:- start:417 stop:1118 length:702 start_codon:yes stop_codon:yes gene_type:complete
MFLGQKITCVIPARLSSSRFPRKPLALIKDRAMVLRVADIAAKSKYIDNIIIATEDNEIKELCEQNNYESRITDTHYTCTHRVAEVSETIESDFIINLQGDEPLINFEWLDKVIKYGVRHQCDMVQPMRQLEESDIKDEDVVKMICNNGKITNMMRTCELVCDNIVVQLGFYLYKINVIRDFPNCDMGIVKYWKGLDTIGFIGKYNVVPFDLNCGKIRSVDRPHHIQEVEDKL